MTDINKSDSRWASGAGIPGIVKVGDPRLRRIAEEYRAIEELRPLCEELVERLRQYKGAGIAASQLGRTEPVVVVEVRKTDMFPERPESPLYVMINPKIIEMSGVVTSDWEGCFSVPGMMAKVPRHSEIRVLYNTPDGELQDEVFSGYLSRVIQHEVDHLSGVLFTDKMDSATLTTVENWLSCFIDR